MQNQPTILQKIVQDKAIWVKNAEQNFPLTAFQTDLTHSDRDFYAAIAQGSHHSPAYILECKKASPSKGLIRTEFDIENIAKIYKNYASVISVLTDEAYFQGDFKYKSSSQSRFTTYFVQRFYDFKLSGLPCTLLPS